MASLEASASLVELLVNSVWFYLLLGVLIGVVLTAVIHASRRGEEEEKEEEKEEASEEKVPEGPGKPIGLDEVLGLDKALAYRFYSELKKALRENKVRAALVSELCPNARVAYDFATSRWICVEEDGTSYPMGSKPALETIEFFEEDEEG